MISSTASDFFQAFHVMAQDNSLIVSLPRQTIKDLYSKRPFQADAWTFPSQSVISTGRGKIVIPNNIIFPVTGFLSQIFPNEITVLTNESDDIEVTPLVLHNTLRDQLSAAGMTKLVVLDDNTLKILLRFFCKLDHVRDL